MNEQLISVLNKYYAENFSALLIFFAINVLVTIFLIIMKAESIGALQTRIVNFSPLVRKIAWLWIVCGKVAVGYKKILAETNGLFLSIATIIYVSLGC